MGLLACLHRPRTGGWWIFFSWSNVLFSAYLCPCVAGRGHAAPDTPPSPGGGPNIYNGPAHSTGQYGGSIRRGARAVHARCGYWGCSVDPFIQSQSGGMVTPQSPAGTIYNSSPRRPSPGEVVQIPDAVRARCMRGARAVRILPHGEVGGRHRRQKFCFPRKFGSPFEGVGKNCLPICLYSIRSVFSCHFPWTPKKAATSHFVATMNFPRWGQMGTNVVR